MQATQSSTAAGIRCHEDYEERLEALKNVGHHLVVGAEETPLRLRGDESCGDIGLIDKAAELLTILHLNRMLRVRPELCCEDMAAICTELGELIERSWVQLERLLEFSQERDRALSEAQGPVYFEPVRRPGPWVERGEATKRKWVLEEGAAGWIAC